MGKLSVALGLAAALVSGVVSAEDTRAAQARTWTKQGLLLKVQPSPKVPGDAWVHVSRKFALLSLDKQTEIAEAFCGLTRDLSIEAGLDPIVHECRFILGSTDIGAVDFSDSEDGEYVVPAVAWTLAYEAEVRRREFARAK
jgi:hypothetical protein